MYLKVYQARISTLKGGFTYHICIAAAIIAGHLDVMAQEICLPSRWQIQLQEVKPLHSTDTLTICILGDIMMHSKQIEDAMRADSTYEFRCFDMIKGKIHSADIAVGNMEFTLAGKPYSGYPRFSAPESFASYLAECGFDVFLTANNHILDMGSIGAARTFELYRELEKHQEIRYTGGALDECDYKSRNPLMIRRKGHNVAMVNFTYGTNLGKTSLWPEINYIRSKEKNREMIAAARARGAETVIAFPHWGDEYQLRHSEAQETAASWLADSGVDLIIGAHPHVVQDFGLVGKRHIPVAYSLGNAVSNMSAPNTQIELMVLVRITRDDKGNTEMLPLEFTYLWCSRPGGYTDTYMVIPVRESIGSRDRWIGKWEYDKMIETYYRVMSETGIKDNTYNE